MLTKTFYRPCVRLRLSGSLRLEYHRSSFRRTRKNCVGARPCERLQVAGWNEGGNTTEGICREIRRDTGHANPFLIARRAGSYALCTIPADHETMDCGSMVHYIQIASQCG
jgi:hypothetical protein